MQRQIDIGVICWIKADPHPLTSPALQAGLLSPGWIPKTVVGLVATANSPPAPVITDFEATVRGINHRALVYCRVHVDIDESTRRISRSRCAKEIISSGWTPRFDASRLGSNIMSVAAKVVDSMKDPKPYPGEASPVSGVMCSARHPNSAIASTPPMHTVIANGVVKFRAGAHTDAIGIDKAESPYHVPWVWSEFLLTYANGEFVLTTLGSAFPTHSWYVQGKLVLTQAELSDSSFPTEGLLGRTIVVKALNLYPALSTGAPATGPQAPRSESPAGALPTHPYTLRAGAPQTYKFRL